MGPRPAVGMPSTLSQVRARSRAGCGDTLRPVPGSGPGPRPVVATRPGCPMGSAHLGPLGRAGVGQPEVPGPAGPDLVQPEEVDGDVLEPTGLSDEAQHSLLGVQAPLLTVHGRRVPEDVGAAPLGDDLGKGRRPVGPCLLSSPACPSGLQGLRPRAWAQKVLHCAAE